MRSIDYQDKPLFGKAMNYVSVGVALGLAYPIDFIRCRMQTMPELVKLGHLITPYSNIIDCAKRVHREEGTRAFWKGNSSNLSKFFIAEGMNWYFKIKASNILLNQLNPSENSLISSFGANFLGGAFGGLFVRFLLYPLEVNKQKCCNDLKNQQKRMFNCLRTIYQKNGLKGIYKGSLASFVGVAIFRSTYFGIFDTYKNSTQYQYQRWCWSYIGVFFAILFTYPIDTIRRRMIQANESSHKYQNFWDCVKKIYRNERWRGFFSGGTVIFLQSISSATVYYMVDKIIRQDIKL